MITFRLRVETPIQTECYNSVSDAELGPLELWRGIALFTLTKTAVTMEVTEW